MRRIGCLLAILAGLVFLVALVLLPVVEIGQFSRTFWDLTTTEPIVLTAVASIGTCLAIASLVQPRALTAVLVSVCATYLFGKVFSLSDFSSALGVGYWTMVSASLAMMLGGVLASVGSATVRNTAPPSRQPALGSPYDTGRASRGSDPPR
jgi:ABC-type sugar transport system permease subunit